MKKTRSRVRAVSGVIGGVLVGGVAGVALMGAVAAAPASQEKVSYELDVKPILDSRCTACHQPGGDGFEASGLDLSSYDGLMKGTKHGAVVVPGDPLTSNLNVLIEGRAQVQMPHDQRPLLRAQQQIIRDWVRQGAENN